MEDGWTVPLIDEYDRVRPGHRALPLHLQAGFSCNVDDRTHALVQTIWDYHHVHHQFAQADAILVLCSHDTIVAEWAAQLFLDRWAPLLIFAGGRGSITSRLWSEPEADRFAGIAVGMGVPKESILIENRSTNTGENILFTKQLLADRDLDPQRFIVVQKPYMERRSYATFKQLWPERDVVVTSPRMSLDVYLENHSHIGLSIDKVISIMVGDLQRIRLYPDKGFQIPQEIPADVWSAFEALVHAGYDKHLVEEHERISSEPARPTSRGSRARRATDPAARGG